MLISVGSAGNSGEGMGQPPRGPEAWSRDRPLGAAWGPETDRAAVLAFDLDGRNRKIFATGIRNCVGLAIQPQSGTPWCSTNERDGLGDNLVPDYVTRVREGAFYGWPWFYIGGNEDPRHAGTRPDLKDKVTVPDVLLQAHSASLGLTFYQGSNFPADYIGDGFAAEHGSWNRSKRTGYKVVRIRLKDGVPTGEYEDFVTGFVIDDFRGLGSSGRRHRGARRRVADIGRRQRHHLAGQPLAHATAQASRRRSHRRFGYFRRTCRRIWHVERGLVEGLDNGGAGQSCCRHRHTRSWA